MKRLSKLSMSLVLLTAVLIPGVALALDDPPTVTSLESAEQLCGKPVRVVARYKSAKYIPDASTAGVWIPGKDPIPHITAKLVLSDDGEIEIGPPKNKASLRTPKEAEQFEGVSVQVRGKLELHPAEGSHKAFYWIQPQSIEAAED
jgi:hypothetical protein